MGAMKIVLAPVGTRGDVQPMVALAQALMRREHDVVLCVMENFRALVENAGCRYVRGGQAADELTRLHGEKLGRPIPFARLARRLMIEQVTLLEEASAGADLIIGTPLLVSGSSVASWVGARYAAAIYFPHILPTKTM